MKNFRARLLDILFAEMIKLEILLCNFSSTHHFSFFMHNLQQRVVKGKAYQLAREQALHEGSHEKAGEKVPDISRKCPAIPYQS